MDILMEDMTKSSVLYWVKNEKKIRLKIPLEKRGFMKLKKLMR